MTTVQKSPRPASRSPLPARAPLPAKERTELAGLEKKIKAGLADFMAVGTALCRIRDARLYRADYDTFAAYCRERWGFGRRRAYQLIEAALTTEIRVHHGAQPAANERQARAQAEELRGIAGEALADLPPEQQRAAVEKQEERALARDPATVGGDQLEGRLGQCTRLYHRLRRATEAVLGDSAEDCLGHLTAFWERFAQATEGLKA